MSSADYNEIVQGRPPRPPQPPWPPQPPHPGDPDELQLLRDTVEIQARTIRWLLTNYEGLLRKVEHEGNGHDLVVEYEFGEEKTFALNEEIPSGLWMAAASGAVHYDIGAGVYKTLGGGDLVFGGDEVKANQANTRLIPIKAKVEPEKPNHA